MRLHKTITYIFISQVYGRTFDTVHLIPVLLLPHVDRITMESDTNLGLSGQPALVYVGPVVWKTEICSSETEACIEKESNMMKTISN